MEPAAPSIAINCDSYQFVVGPGPAECQAIAGHTASLRPVAGFAPPCPRHRTATVMNSGRHPPGKMLGDSHFSLQHRPGLAESATTMDCVELFHATSHGDGTRGFIVAVPSSQPGDDPACRREA